jgi:signal transduction histidine kinase
LAVLIVHDITRRKLAEAEIREARDQLARSNQELEQRVRERTTTLSETIQELERFSYSLSHDMRAPLRAIGNYAQILRVDMSDRLGPEGDEMLSRISKSAARLDRLILDVLSLSRLSNGPMEMHPVDLEKLLNQIIHERHSLQSHRASIEFKKPLLQVCGHEALITQCLSNLLDNAVKFVAPGVHPQVRIWSELIHSDVGFHKPSSKNSSAKTPHPSVAQPKQMVRVWIEDNGIGIPDEYHDRIFAMFERLHGVESYQGTGIGLAIVRKAVERMGGTVGVDSQPGHGSRFWLDLPSAPKCS